MRKILVWILLICIIMMTGCGSKNTNSSSNEVQGESIKQQIAEQAKEYESITDPGLLRYVEDSVYSNLLHELNNNKYFVENVQAVYVSKEYLDEISFNSQENIYFGYTASQLDKQFKGEKYVFKLGDDGKTVVSKFEKYDDTYDKALKRIAIGGGVILLCVTVSAVTGGAGAPAVSLVFAASAKSGAAFAVSGGLFGGVTAGVVEGIETKDFDKAKKAAAQEGSKGFMWGAVTGALAGGAASGSTLIGEAKQTRLSINEYAMIQKESKYPVEVVKQFKSMKEYNVYKNAGLKAKRVDGKYALCRKDFDLDRIDEYGMTNRARMVKGKPPLDSEGKAFELHHIGQKKDSPLAILKWEEHRGKSVNKTLHKKKKSEVHYQGDNWQKEVKIFWKEFSKTIEGN